MDELFPDENIHEEIEDLNKMIEQVHLHIYKGEIDLALDLNIISYEKALSIDKPALTSEVLFYFGSIESSKGNSQKAMSFYVQSLNMARSCNNYKCITHVLNAIANQYGLYGESKRALDAYMDTLNIIEKHAETTFKKPTILNNIGLTFFELDAYEDAEKYYNDALIAANETPQNSYSDKLIIGIIYSNLAELYLKKKAYDNANRYLLLARESSQNLNDYIGIATCLAIEATLINERDNNWQTANSLFINADKLMNKYGAEYEIADLNLKYGNQAFIADKSSLSCELLEKAYKLASNYQYVHIQLKICELLEKIYFKNKELEKAYNMAKEQLDIKKSIDNQWGYTGISIVQDIDNVDSRQLEELKRTIQTLKMLAQVGQYITASIDIKHIFSIVSKNISKIMNLSTFALGLLNESRTEVTSIASDEGEYKEFKFKIDNEYSFMVWCIKHKREIIIYNSEDTSSYSNSINEKLMQVIKKSNTKSLLFCPLYDAEKVIGGVTVQSILPYNFSYVDLEVLRLLTSYISIAINNIYKSKKLLETNKKLEAVSRIDGLTGLLNRYALGKFIANEFTSFEIKQLPVSMIMIDLDYFKQYNDFYGHIKGDKCLIAISNVIKDVLSSLSSKHYAFRYGGDEFLLVLENFDLNLCEDILKKLLQKIQELNIEHQKSKTADVVTITAGASIFKRLLTDYVEAFSSADEALYIAKNKGRNCYDIKIIS